MSLLRAFVSAAVTVWIVLVAVCVLAVTAGVLVGFGAIGYRLMVGP